ncbi:MAG TPA: LPXTG cell wall anchor domain-containing protein [Solirubrobacteraceae bacterium]|jgi:LPXTG-motif cell wall-anchored protein
MRRRRAIVVLLALVLAVPSLAFAQGAGDEQYQDPFGDEQAQNDRGDGGGGNTNGRAAQDDGGGLTDEPPVGGGDDGGDTTPPPNDSGDDAPDEEDSADDQAKALPNTGSDPRILAYVGLVFVLAGVGLRLRTLDPDSF